MSDQPFLTFNEISKAMTVSDGGGPRSNAQELAEDSTTTDIFRSAGILDPPYDPGVLAQICENSSALRPNIDAYVVNIDSYGHTLKPIIDLESPDSDKAIRQALRYESGKDPTDEEVKARRDTLEGEISDERQKLDAFFESCAQGLPFSGPEGLRGLTRMELETSGNAYWEVLRNGLQDVVAFTRLPAKSMKLTKFDKTPTETTFRRRTSLLGTKEDQIQKRFRRYVQFDGQSGYVFFKEFGDPRVISSASGKPYTSEDEMKRAEPDAAPATEVISFKISSPRSEYGIPRWIGVLLAVLGNRQAEEVNFMYFDNKSIPPLAVLVSGGRLNSDSAKRLEDYMNNNLKGRKNFHSVLILEAESAMATAMSASPGDTDNGKMKIVLQPLTEAQQKDGLFLDYDERNADKIGQVFRLPRLLRGDVRDFNRSCYSEDTETLTENGWKLYSDIGPKEKIAAYLPDAGEVRFVVPEAKLVYDVSGEEMVHLHNKKTDCLVTRDHRMLVGPVDRGAPWKRCLAGDIVNMRCFTVPVAASIWAGEERTSFALPKKCQIERGHQHCADIRFDDWLEFLGYFISEGGLVRTSHPSAGYLVYIDQKKEPHLSKMRACLDRLGWKYSVQIKPCGTTHMLFSNKCLREWLLANIGNNSHDWKLPREYLNLSRRQLTILFDALMLGDGSRGKQPSNGCYYSASKELADQVQEMALKLGKRAHVRRQPTAGVWRTMFSDGTTSRLSVEQFENTPSGVSLEKYTGKVYCFSVPGYGYFVTRRNGKPAIQGNTAQAALDFAEVQVFNPLRQQFDWVMNRLIFDVLKSNYHEFVSSAATIRDPETLATMIEQLTKANVLTPEESRELAEEVFHRTFVKLDTDWTKQPVGITVSGRNQAQAGPNAGTQGQGAGALSVSGAGGTQAESGIGKATLASVIQKLHDKMIEEEREEFLKREQEVIKVPNEIFFALADFDGAPGK